MFSQALKFPAHYGWGLALLGDGGQADWHLTLAAVFFGIEVEGKLSLLYSPSSSSRLGNTSKMWGGGGWGVSPLLFSQPQGKQI